MSVSRRDPNKARQRRDRIRREKHNQRVAQSTARDSVPPPPELQHPFGAERSLRQIQALIEGEKFESIDEANQRLQDLTGTGRLSEMADAWKRDDPKWRAQELAYDALETGSIEEAVRLCHEAQELDPDCTDAQCLMVSVLPMGLENRILLMREVVEKAERNLGEGFFEEHMGHFWGTISTRPYMRAKQQLGELLAKAGRLDEAIPVFERMIELNPNDNQGMRFPLLGLYLAANHPESADRLLSQYPGEENFSATGAWARVLERWLSGKRGEAEAALARARKINPFAERYISGARRLPRETPEYYRLGDETEAQVCANELKIAWQSDPSFREWLRARR